MSILMSFVIVTLPVILDQMAGTGQSMARISNPLM
jgi:hypothetical protein